MCYEVPGYHLGRCLVRIEPLAIRAHEDQRVLIQRLLLAVGFEQLVEECGFLDPERHSASILHEGMHLDTAECPRCALSPDNTAGISQHASALQ